MKRLLFWILVFLAAIVPAILPASAAPKRDELPADVVPGRIVVRFRDRVPEANARSAVRVEGATEVRRLLAGGRFRVLEVPIGREAEVLRRLAANPNVESVGYDHVVRIQDAPTDPYYLTNQWDMVQAGFEDAWSISTGASSVVVAVVDTGIDSTHPEFAGRILPGANFSLEGGETDTIDGHGHGTHVAGIVAAAGNNGIGIAGAAWQIKLLPIKVLDSSGKGSESELAAGMQYAIDQGVKVLNLSLGTPYDAPIIKAALDNAAAAGVLVVAAGGNSGARCDYPMAVDAQSCSFPAAYPYAVGVAATNQFKTRASYSNYGPFVDVAAPGGDSTSPVFSTLPSLLNPFTNPTPRCAAPPCFGTFAGTSQATPHVAGLAALMIASCPNISAASLESIIESTSSDLGTIGRDELYGSGLINAGSALKAVGSPSLQVSPGSLQFIAGTGPQPAPSPVTVTTTPNGACPQGPFTATTNQPWLLVNGVTQFVGTAPTTLSISIDVTRLPTGTTASAAVVLTSGVGAASVPSGSIPVGVQSISGTVPTASLPVVSPNLN